MKHIREIAFTLVLVVAGVAFSQQAKDESKKPAAAPGKKCGCCAQMSTKSGGKMSCCASDSTGTKDEKPAGGKR